MHPVPKLLSRLSRLGQRADDDGESRHLLAAGTKMELWGGGWQLPVASQNNQIEKQQTSKDEQRVRTTFYTKLRPIRSILPRFRRNGPTILSLQDRALHKIYKYLPPVDKACLSLSCKRFFGLFGTILKEKVFQFPRLLDLRIPILCVNSSKVPRNQLLLRLENHEWAYCGRCLKLHPRKEFHEKLLAEPALKRFCAGYAGIIDLCPCATLTFRDMEHLATLLKSPTTPHQTKIGPFTFNRSAGFQSRPHLSHCCSLPTTSDYKAQFKIHISIDSSDNVDVTARYTISFSSSYAHLQAEPIFHCPHRGLTCLMNQKDATQVCPGCRTISVRSRAPESEGPNAFVFDVTRFLGRCKWPPNFRWLDNCRLTGPEFSQNQLYW